MKTVNETEDGRLKDLLREWRVSDAPPPAFAPQVWRKIAQTNAGSGFHPMALVWFGLTSWLRRPALAWAYVMTLLIGGLSLGYWQSELTLRRALNDARMDYLRAVAPVTLTRQ